MQYHAALHTASLQHNIELILERNAVSVSQVAQSLVRFLSHTYITLITVAKTPASALGSGATEALEGCPRPCDQRRA